MCGVTGCYMTNSLSTGDDNYLHEQNAYPATFDSQPRKYDCFHIHECQIVTIFREKLKFSEENCSRNVDVLPHDEICETFEITTPLFLVKYDKARPYVRYSMHCAS